jgi:drug/metabolite transporter (DMT)-like permease
VLLSVALATSAALANASSSVLQRKVAREQAEASSSGLAMLWALAHKPGWWAGIAAIIVGFGLQAGALATGPLALVQPVLVVELAFTLLLAAAVFHTRVHRREWPPWWG